MQFKMLHYAQRQWKWVQLLPFECTRECNWHFHLPGLNRSAQLKKSPCLHAVSNPHLSFVTTVDRTGLSLYSLMQNEQIFNNKVRETKYL